MTTPRWALLLVGTLLIPLTPMAWGVSLVAPSSTAPRTAPAHPARPDRAHPPVHAHPPVRFEGLTLGQKLVDLPPCAADGRTSTLCYATSFDGEKAPPLSASISTVVLHNLPAFLPPVPAGQTPPTALETDREHRGMASVINGRLEEIKIMVPRARIREAARLLVTTFPHTVVDEDAHMLIGADFAIGFGNAEDHVVIGVFSRTFVETMNHDEGTSDDGDATDPSGHRPGPNPPPKPGRPTPQACPLPPDAPSV